jgi:hypothetical protein
MWFKFVLAAIAVLGMADAAFAWGPAVHTALGGSILGDLSLLPAGLAALLARHGASYLYGGIAADIVFAKRWSRIKQFCHHWSTGFRLLESAQCDRDKAFACGYLSHLAADTVAHGKYVPRQVMVSNCTVNFGHLYWELRAEAAQSPATWKRLETLLDDDHDDHHDALECHICDTFLPFELNRLVFDRLNALSVHRGFRRTVDVWSRCSRWYLAPELLRGYHAECVDRIRSVLAEGQHSAVVHDDPNGTSALMQLRVRRREARRLRRNGMPVRHRVVEASRGYAPELSRAPVSDTDPTAALAGA